MNRLLGRTALSLILQFSAVAGKAAADAPKHDGTTPQQEQSEVLPPWDNYTPQAVKPADSNDVVDAYPETAPQPLDPWEEIVPPAQRGESDSLDAYESTGGKYNQRGTPYHRQNTHKGRGHEPG
ncbi:MAG: hypothetical protein OXT65_05410 [Alphaproteobacteria bacterium]|nr:hypothetical protein [Alphaproteobacteria bacterium]